MKPLFALVLCWVFGISAIAQTDFQDKLQNDYYTEVNDSAFTVRNVHFFRNVEYFGKIAEGYTLPGTLLRADFNYHSSDNLKLQIGFHAQKFWGTESDVKFIPYLSFRYVPSEHIQFVLGRLEDFHHIQFLPQLLNPERMISGTGEYGLQILTSGNKLASDTWVNWERFIIQNSPFQEEFTIGNHVVWKTLQYQSWGLQTEWQTIITHKGGQIDADPNPVQSLANTAVGFRLSHHFLGSVQLKHGIFMVGYADLSPAKNLAYIYGRGFYTENSIMFKNLQLETNYWFGDFFITTRGDAIYQSTSVFMKDYKEPQRSILKVGFSHFSSILNFLIVQSYVDVFFDTYNVRQDYAFGIHAFMKFSSQKIF